MTRQTSTRFSQLIVQTNFIADNNNLSKKTTRPSKQRFPMQSCLLEKQLNLAQTSFEIQWKIPEGMKWWDKETQEKRHRKQVADKFVRKSFYSFFISTLLPLRPHSMKLTKCMRSTAIRRYSNWITDSLQITRR